MHQIFDVHKIDRGTCSASVFHSWALTLRSSHCGICRSPDSCVSFASQDVRIQPGHLSREGGAGWSHQAPNQNDIHTDARIFQGGSRVLCVCVYDGVNYLMGPPLVLAALWFIFCCARRHSQAIRAVPSQSCRCRRSGAAVGKDLPVRAQGARRTGGQAVPACQLPGPCV